MRTSVLLLAILLFGCAASGKQAKPAISSGERLYRSSCSLCHRLYSPDLYTYQQLEKYIKKFNRGLTNEERQALSDYLKEAAKENKEVLPE